MRTSITRKLRQTRPIIQIALIISLLFIIVNAKQTGNNMRLFLSVVTCVLLVVNFIAGLVSSKNE